MAVKHAEVIQAYLDGKPIQYFNQINKYWEEMGATKSINPISNPELSWRVKPDPASTAWVEYASERQGVTHKERAAFEAGWDACYSHLSDEGSIR